MVKVARMPEHEIAMLKSPFLVLAALMIASHAGAQSQGSGALAPVAVTAQANRDPVEKSYRSMVAGMDLFERRHALAPNATLRYKLLKRKSDTRLDDIELYVLGNTAEIAVPIAPDQTFTLPRDAKALSENAQVVPNRKAQTMTWRTEVRTPGLPPGTRRLGDLRLECEVGMEAGLFSNARNALDRLANSILNTPAYCHRDEVRYLFFADKPIFGVTLRSGNRRMVLPLDQLYAAASDDTKLASDLPYCDCEVLLDRTYFLPLGDASWPDDTLVEFDYMEGAP